ncbi:unnamed protein product [Mytilus edulis]|uniref:Uncharacterized protein n=1 Tax=Mytilus edulis TaxID=6550 RepID=A0A8S3S2W3_MYTED|nr:unnamed protein product [Mytilus edulis]
MPRKKNCDIVHEGRPPGPCIHCGEHERSDRYTHLIQKKESFPDLYAFVKTAYKIEDEGCICRKCELLFSRKCDQNMHVGQDIEDAATPVKKQYVQHEGSAIINKHLCYLAKDILCNKDEKLKTSSVDIGSFEKCFHIKFDKTFIQPGNEQVAIDLCHTHYMQFKNFAARSNCCICERSTTKMKTVNVEDRLGLLQLYITQELQNETLISEENHVLCLSCYKAFNNYTKSDEMEKSRSNTDEYLTDCLSVIDVTKCDEINIDTYCYQKVLQDVISSFRSYKPLLLYKLHCNYVSEVDKAIDEFRLVVNEDRLRAIQHRREWLFTMLKSSLGPALCVYTPPKKQQGRMIYRRGTDLLQCLHSSISDHSREIDEFNEKISSLENKLNSNITNIAESSSLNSMECLDKTVRLMKNHVKLYVQDSMKTQLPDIHSFNLYEEIRKVNPTLWNFIYVLTSNEEEERK